MTNATTMNKAVIADVSNSSLSELLSLNLTPTLRVWWECRRVAYTKPQTRREKAKSIRKGR